MANTHKWTTAFSSNGPISSNTLCTDVFATIPAGTRLDRVILRMVVALSVLTNDVADLIRVHNHASVNLTSTSYNGGSLKVIYDSYNIVPLRIAGFWGGFIPNQTWLGSYHAGDRELLVDFSCSYGGPGKAQLNLEFRQFFEEINSSSHNKTFNCQRQVKYLTYGP